MPPPHNFTAFALFQFALNENIQIDQLNSNQSSLDLYLSEGISIIILLDGDSLYELFWSCQYGCNRYYEGRKIDHTYLKKSLEGSKRPLTYIDANRSKMVLYFQETKKGYVRISSKPQPPQTPQPYHCNTAEGDEDYWDYEGDTYTYNS